ncbi:MAG: alpha/beta hydrolase [Sandaracinaceae bacterium]
MTCLRSISALAVLMLACGGPPLAAPPPRSSAATIALELVSTDGDLSGGRVAWAWMPEDEFAPLAAGQPTDATLVALFEAFRVTEPIDLATGAPETVGEVDASGAGGFVAVYEPLRGHFLETVAGRPSPASRLALSEIVRPMSTDPVTVRIELRARPEGAPRPERCAGERRELTVIDAPEVVGEADNDPSRRLCVMLPPSYATAPDRRYPTIYLLHGYGGDDTVYLHLADARDRLAESGAPEAILVGVDSHARYGASYFHDTPYAGAWEGFIAHAVREIDARYRTQADPRMRGLIGHSTGGYNAISLALRRTDLFTAAAASSPDGLDFDAWLFDGGHARPLWLHWTRLEAAFGGGGQMISYAAQLDPEARAEPAWPFDLRTGERDATVWARWVAATPRALLDDPAVARRVERNLNDRLFISVGRHDAFGLFDPAERFHARLDELGIANTWAPTDGTHFDGSQERREAGLAFLLERMAARTP